MFANTKIALTAALILGTASAAHARQNVVKSYDGNPLAALSENARGSYAQAQVDSNPSTKPTATVRPLTQFEKNWFEYQDRQ